MACALALGSNITQQRRVPMHPPLLYDPFRLSGVYALFRRSPARKLSR